MFSCKIHFSVPRVSASAVMSGVIGCVYSLNSTVHFSPNYVSAAKNLLLRAA
jgi:hypothetical protein